MRETDRQRGYGQSDRCLHSLEGVGMGRDGKQGMTI